MNKIIIQYGLLSGILVCIWLLLCIFVATDVLMDFGMFFGYASMLLAFCLIFVAIHKYKNSTEDGIITFGRGFKIGFFITLIASTIYVVTWLIEYQFFIPDFMESYSETYLKRLKESGISEADLMAKTKEMKEMSVMYKNNFFYRAAFTYIEILPTGILMSLIAALVYSRKSKKSTTI
jgi:hypothetical protein